MQERIVDLDGPVHYADFGGSGPAMVLVHGLGGSSLNWLAVGPRLARRGRVLAPDLAGFGRTAPGRRSARLRANRELLNRFLGAVVGAPAILVGNSMGGLQSMLQAVAHPASVAGLVLAAPAQPRAPGTRVGAEVWAAFALYAIPGVAEWYLQRRAGRLGPEGLVREMLRICCVDPSRVPADVTRAHVELTRDRMTEMPWATRAFLDAARSLLTELWRARDYRAMVDRIASPTLLIQGAADRLVPAAASRDLARRRPDWTFEVLDRIGHVPQLEDPEGFTDRMERWLDGPGRIAILTAGGDKPRRGE